MINFSILICLLADLYRRTNRLDEAVREYERLLDKNPKVASAHMLLGMIAEQRKDHAHAKNHYRTTLEIDPNFAPAANNLAWLLAEGGGNLDEALSYAENALAQSDGNPNIADTLGWIYYKKRDYVKALSLLQEAAEKIPENPLVLYHLGMAQFKKGDLLNAKKSLQRAFQLSPDFPGSERGQGYPQSPLMLSGTECFCPGSPPFLLGWSPITPVRPPKLFRSSLNEGSS